MAWSKDKGTIAKVNADYAKVQGDYAKTEANKVERFVEDNKTKWLPAVATVAARNSAYPNPEHGDTVRVTSEAKTYRYVSPTGWVVTDIYDASAIDQVAQQLAQTTKISQGMTLSVIPNVFTENNYTGIVPIVFKDGWLWGIQDNNKFVKSNNDGETWQYVANTPYGSLHSIFWTNDGEILVSNASDVRKSVGWSVNPATATWVTKLTKSAPEGVGILPWGIDGDGQKFIVNEYSGPNRADSRYMWISTDMGNTFNVVLDKLSIDPENTSHMHGVCYDKWGDRFFVSHGHGVLMRVYWSADDGATWNPLGGDFRPDAAPTTLTATDNGIVCGSDSGDAGLYGIPRTKNPADMRMIKTARWYVPREGVTGFAYRGVRDEKTGQVFVCFKTDFDDIKPVIMAGTATSAATIWESPVASGSNFPYLAVTDNKVWGIIDRTGVRESVIGDKPEFGVPNFDKGNVMTGKASSTSIVIGRNTFSTTAEETLIGNDIVLEPLSSKQRNVVIGSFARGSSFSTVIGSNAQIKNNTSNNVAIGADSSVSATNAIAIGKSANVQSGATGGIAIGQGTDAYTGAVVIGVGAKSGSGTVNATALGSSAYAGTSAVAVGRLASAGSSQVAIGLSAISNHLNSIALGANVVTTAADQLNIGGRHLEMKKVSEPTAVPVDAGRLFVMDDGAGNMQLCVRLGAKTTVLATSV